MEVGSFICLSSTKENFYDHFTQNLMHTFLCEVCLKIVKLLT